MQIVLKIKCILDAVSISKLLHKYIQLLSTFPELKATLIIYKRDILENSMLEVRLGNGALISYCIDDDDTVGAWRSQVCLRITYTQCSIISPQMLQLRIFRVSRQFANTRQKNAANPVTGAFASYLLCICTID